jgi:hypothetical protein
MRKFFFFGTFLAIGDVFVFAIDKTPPPSVPVQMVVTVEARHGDAVPALKREDFAVAQPKESFQVTDAVPLVGNNAALELYLLIDDASSFRLGSQLDDIRHFIEAQPPSTAIGVGYMQYGTVQTVEALTRDHARAAKTLRLPMGVASSPYLSLNDLIKRWPKSAARREVIMVTSGADPLGGNGSIDPYLDTAIAAAQRAGVIVSAIYTPGEGHEGHSYWRIFWGQNYIAELADDTGGESYMLGFAPLVSFAPYLTRFSERLTHQYQVSLLAKASARPELTAIKLTTEVPNAEIVAASKVYVPTAR